MIDALARPRRFPTAVTGLAVALAMVAGTHPAHGHCDAPEIYRPLFASDGSGDVVLFMSFGSALARGGGPFQLLCDEIFVDPADPIGANDQILTPSGRIVVGYSGGVLTSADRACSYGASKGLPVVDGRTASVRSLALAPWRGPAGVVAATSDSLLVSADGGDSFEPWASFAGRQLAMVRSGPAPSAGPHVTYAVAFVSKPSLLFSLHRAADDGPFAEVTSEFGADRIAVLAIGPGDRIFVSVDRPLGFDVYRSDAGGMAGSWQRIDRCEDETRPRSCTPHLALGPGDDEVWLGQPGDDAVAGAGRLRHSTTAGDTWTDVAGTHPHFRCLAVADGALWACGNNLAARDDGFALGRSSDGGGSWLRHFAFGELCEATPCLGGRCAAIFESACVPGLCVPGASEPGGDAGAGDGVDGPGDGSGNRGSGGDDGAADGHGADGSSSGGSAGQGCCRVTGPAASGDAAVAAAALAVLLALATARRRHRGGRSRRG